MEFPARSRGDQEKMQNFFQGRGMVLVLLGFKISEEWSFYR